MYSVRGEGIDEITVHRTTTVQTHVLCYLVVEGKRIFQVPCRLYLGVPTHETIDLIVFVIW